MYTNKYPINYKEPSGLESCTGYSWCYIQNYPSSSYQVKTDGTHTNTRKYYSFSGAVVAMSENGAVTWLLQDQVNSTTITANADGSLASEVRYSAFGEIRASTGTTVTDKKYTGQQQESEIGLDYYVSRFYDPTIAHFLQADSLIPQPGKSKAFDRYAYVSNNPIIFNDPSGKRPSDPNDYADWRNDSHKNCFSIAVEKAGGVDNLFVKTMAYPIDQGSTYVSTLFGHQNTMDDDADLRIGKDGGLTKEKYLSQYGVHAAVDISLRKPGEMPNIYSVYNGEVVWAQEGTTNGGSKIVIRHEFGTNVYYSFYFHLSEIDVKVGQYVTTGQQIGVMGESGTKGTPHLHFEIRTEVGVGEQSENGTFSFPGAAGFWWANSPNELSESWVDISSRFGGYDPFLPETWK
jgi:RHS repeat-associated protein